MFQGDIPSRFYPFCPLTVVSYYNDLRANSLCELLKPHISIYLDAPVSTIQERRQKKADVGDVLYI